MKVLTAAEMREVDRRTVELGIPELVLMENAGHRVVELLAEKFAPLARQRVVIFVGKGNNGGDGLVVARQLLARFRPAALDVVLAESVANSVPLRMFEACGGKAGFDITPEMRRATLIVDALLGTGIVGAPRGRYAELIEEINTGFPDAAVVAVDLPSGLNSDTGWSPGPVARADYTVTFTAPKIAHALPPGCDQIGEMRVGHIGSPSYLMDPIRLHLAEPADFESLLAPRERNSNKGDYGHVLVLGGAEGKTGAAEMAGWAALRAGAGLVTVACSDLRLRFPELMTATLPRDPVALESVLHRKTVAAVGPGLGTEPPLVDLVRRLVSSARIPVVVDADGLNALVGFEWRAEDALRILTPHPGEMARLCGTSVEEIQRDRLGAARHLAELHQAVVVLKGHRTVIAFPDGRAWINPTGTPALATAGTGDILTGLIAGFLAQFPAQAEQAVPAAVYLHGLAGQLGARQLTEKCLTATDILTYLPHAIASCASI